MLFLDDDDFKVGMNFVAIQAACCKEVRVYAFILMSNHTHFVLNGFKHDVLYFVNQFKLRYSLYFQRKYGVRELLRRNEVDIRPIPENEEVEERVLAYVQMNAVAANICAIAAHYPWGTGSCFFNPTPHNGKRVGDFSARALRKLLHTDCSCLSKDWRIGPGGFILPEYFVDVQAVEALFRTPKRMNYFLNSSSKARKRIESADAALPAFRDQTILAALPDLCRSLFGKGGFQDLALEEQAELLRQAHFRFSAEVKQLARVCGLTYEQAAHLLDYPCR